MAIRHIKVENAVNHGIRFKEDPLAHKYLDGLTGIEIGAASHNDFGLDGSTAVGLKELDRADHDFFANEQAKMCGQYVDIEIDAEADKLPLENESQDYVITSHVIEHTPNPIKAFKEWDRVLRVGGYIYMIFPKRNALEQDQSREITPLKDFIRAHEENWNANNVPTNFLSSVPGGRRGHYWVFTLNSMKELLFYAIPYYDIVEQLETDLKVGNGHTVVLQKVKNDAT